jgi:hypothetical protein
MTGAMQAGDRNRRSNCEKGEWNLSRENQSLVFCALYIFDRQAGGLRFCRHD